MFYVLLSGVGDDDGSGGDCLLLFLEGYRDICTLKAFPAIIMHLKKWTNMKARGKWWAMPDGTAARHRIKQKLYPEHQSFHFFTYIRIYLFVYTR